MLIKSSHIFLQCTNLLINSLKFEECGSSKLEFGVTDYWAAISLNYCSNVSIINSCVYNPVEYGISALM